MSGVHLQGSKRRARSLKADMKILPRLGGDSLRMGIWLLLLGSVLLWGYTRNQNFPFWYNWDEEGKALQISTGERNLRHPVLILNVAEATLHAVPAEGRQHATTIGRLTASFFVAGAVVLCSALAWSCAGPLAGMATGVFMGGHPSLITAAHHFKEDAALLFGWALSVLALDCARRRPGRFTSLLTGGAIAVCASGKHIGWLGAGIALPLLWSLPADTLRERALRVVYFLAALLSVWCVINHQMLSAATVIHRELSREMKFLLQDRIQSTPPGWTLLQGLGWPVALGLLLYAGQVIRRKQTPLWTERVFLVWLGLYFLLLISIERVVSRYYLPLWGGLSFFAALGWVRAWQMPPGSMSVRAIVRGVFLVASVAQLYKAREWTRHFGGPDHRMELARYLDQQLPGAYVAYDLTVNLPDPALPERTYRGWLPRTRLMALPRWDGGKEADPIRELRRQGITHVAVNLDYVARYEQYDLQPRLGWGQFADANIRLPFYQALRESNPPVWYRPVGNLKLLAPELALYKLPAADPLPGP